TILPAAQADLAIVQRFFREAKLLSQLNHPNIVNIIDFGVAEPGPIPFMVMELIKGQSLDHYVTASRRAPLPLVLSLMTQICAGVEAAQDCQIIHRDLKPSNIFVVPVSGSQFPTVKILDFGLAKPVEQLAPGKTPITQAGTAMGTCGFTAPEQLQATSEPDTRSDIYSLGAVLYYLLTGQLPFKGNTHNAVMLKQMTGTPEPLDFTTLNLQGAEGLDGVIRKAMSFVPNDRYRTPAELLLAVEAAVATLVPPTRSPLPLTPPPGPEPAKLPPTIVKKKPFNWVTAAASSLLLL